MNAISMNSRVFVAPLPLDFRKRIDGTHVACRQLTDLNPLDGALFLFTNKSRTMLRCYYFDGHGEWLVEKRVATGKFPWWGPEEIPTVIEPTIVNLLFRGANPRQTRLPEPWKKIG